MLRRELQSQDCINPEGKNIDAERIIKISNFLRIKMRYKKRIFNTVVPAYLQEACSRTLRRCLTPQIVQNPTYTVFCFFVFLNTDVPMIVASWVAQLVKNLPAMQESPIRFLSQEIPLEKG